MCVVSMVGDHFNEKWKDKNFQFPNLGGYPPLSVIQAGELEELKKEVREMKLLLLRAVEYDKRNNEPACEMEEKVALLKKVAELVGVSLEDVFPND